MLRLSQTLRRAVAAVALVAGGAAVAQPAPKLEAERQTSISLPPFARDVLTAHNAARAAVGAPPLKWNGELAAHAQARAAELAQIRQLVHASREGRGTERENILQAPLGYSPGQMMERWTRERSHLVPGLFPDVSNTGNWMDVAHYTQMIWAQTTDIGCGYAPGGGFNWVVCRYNPGGNKDGKPVVQSPQVAGTFQTNKDAYHQQYVDAELEFQKRFSQNAQWKASALKGPGVPSDAREPNRTVGGDETAVQWGADVDLVSKYIWRGFMLDDQPSLGPNVWSNAYGFAASAWFELAVNQLSDPLGLDIAEDEPVCHAGRIEPGVAAAYDLGTNILPKYNYPVFDSLDEEAPLTGRLWFWGSGNYQKIEGAGDASASTAVPPPNLRGLPEVFGPGALTASDISDCVM